MTIRFSKTIASALALPAMIAASATSAYGADIAYAWANRQASATYTPDSNYAFNDGQPVQVTRRSQGRYRVAFGRVVGAGANVQVQLYGADAGYCNTQGWSNGTVDVRCYNAGGSPADRRFVILAIKATAGEEAQIAYAWLSNQIAASYSAAGGYSFGPGDMNVTRTTAGNYRVNLANNVRNRHISLATGYGTDARCDTTLNTRGRVQVTCINPSEALVDARSSVLLLREGIARMSMAFNVSFDGELGAAHGLASDGSAQSVQRISEGRYRVVIGPEANPGGHVQVSAILTRAHCWPEGWGGGAVTVRCARNGALTDAGFGVVAIARGGARAATIVAPPVVPAPTGPALEGPKGGVVPPPVILAPSGPIGNNIPDSGVILPPVIALPTILRVEEEAYAPNRTGPGASVAYKLAGKGSVVDINYEIIDGWAIAEGDIILGRHDAMTRAETERRSCSGDICSVQSPLIRRSGENYLWPGGVIPYEIDSAFPAAERQSILDGIALVDGVTNLIVKPRAGESDYVRFKRVNNGCSSPVGRQGGRQEIKIKKVDDTWCPPGAIAHETLHSAGIWHEQSREDRNTFVRILNSNIRSGKGHNFDRHISDGTDIAGYDYGSIMHYGATAFGKLDAAGNPKITIEVRTPGAIIGNRTALSARDISGVNGLYANEDCIYFNPDAVSVSRQSGWWRLDERLADGRTHQIIKAGDTRTEANRTLALVRNYRLDQVCFVGRPDASAMYFLSAGSAPSGAYGGEDCNPIDPAGSRVVKDNGKWKIVKDTSAGREAIMQFPNPGEAYRTLDIWRQRNFRFSCYVGRPDPAVRYYRR